MRGFNDASFTLVFNRLVSASNMRLDKDEWQVGEVSFQRQRHSYWGHEYAFSVEIYTLRARARESWELMVVRENWWGGGHAPVRTSQWGKLVAGSKSAALDWFRRQSLAMSESGARQEAY